MTSRRAYALVSAIFVCLFMFAVLPGRSMASEESEKALKEQMHLMQQQMEELRKEVQALRHEQQTAAGSSGAAQPQVTTAPTVATAPATQDGMPTPTPKSAKETS